MGHAHFQNNKICISWEPTRPDMVCLKSVESCSSWFLTQKRNPPLSKSLPVCKCNTGFLKPLFLVYGLLLVNGLLMRMLKDKQICKHLYMHMHTFQKTILINPHSWPAVGHTPGLIIVFYCVFSYKAKST